MARPKTPLAALERAVELAQHDQDDPKKAPSLTTWTAYGQLEDDAIGPLAGRPIESLRIYETQARAPLDGLKRLPKLRALFIEEPDMSAARVLEAALEVEGLEVLVFRPALARGHEEVSPALIERLAALEAVELRNVTVSNLDALFARRGLVDVALSGLKGVKAVTIEDHPALRRLHLVIGAEELRLAHLPALEEAILGGGYQRIEIQGLPKVAELDLPIADHATVRAVGAKRISVCGLSSFELADARALEVLDLEGAIESLPAARVAALRAELPGVRVRPAPKKPKAAPKKR